MDRVDERIVALLREDARRLYQDIGSHVHLSAPAVKRRVDRLEASGVIRGYIGEGQFRFSRRVNDTVANRYGGILRHSQATYDAMVQLDSDASQLDRQACCIRLLRLAIQLKSKSGNQRAMG